MVAPVLIEKITPLLITLNEAANIRRALDSVRWARRIVIVDSGSTDETSKIVAGYPQAEFLHRPFASFADQCNFGMSQVHTEWVLSLDADYELNEELITHLRSLQESSEIGGYRAKFVYRIYGRPLRGSLYPHRVVVHRVGGATYIDEGHGHRVLAPGKIEPLHGAIFHDDRKPLARWFRSQQRYAELEAEHLLRNHNSALSFVDRIRRLGWPAPILVGPYVLVIKRCLLDGWAGWFYTLQRVLAEVMLALAIMDRRLRGRTSDAR